MFNIECRHFLLCILYIVSCIACSGKKYTANDGESIFSNQNNLIEDIRLADAYVEEPVVLDNICWKTTDFDYQNAGISMKSYPKINKSEYKKYFARKGSLDFYLHPIICENVVYDVKNDAEIVAYTLENGKVKKKWSNDTLTFQEKKNILVANARLEDDILYISTSNGFLLAFDIDKKEIIWKKKFDAIFSSSPSINDDNIYITSTNNKLFAVNKYNGKIEWNIKDKKTVVSSFQTAPVAIFNDKVVSCFSNGEILVAKTNGDILWKNKVLSANGVLDDNMDIDFPPILVGNVLVVGGNNTSVMGFDFKTGQPLWQIPTGLNSFMLYNQNGFGFFVNNNNENICFYTQNGAIKYIKPNTRYKITNLPGYLNNGKNVKIQTINRYFDAYYE